MRILIDTNVIVDYILKRENFFEHAAKVVALCDSGKVIGAVSSQSVADTFYILRKDFSATMRKAFLLELCDIFHVEAVDEIKILLALADETFTNFEDCLQVQCAKSFRADYIITRNVKDFAASEIPAVTPEDFFELEEVKSVL